MACVAPESADPRRGQSEISNLDGFSSAANDRFRRLSPAAAVPAEVGYLNGHRPFGLGRRNGSSCP